MTEEQIRELVKSMLVSFEQKIQGMIDKELKELEIPDTRNMAQKKFVTDTVEALRVAVTEEISKTNVAVNKIATETETKITELSTKKKGFTLPKTLCDYDYEPES
jgi:hypothetical protein